MWGIYAAPKLTKLTRKTPDDIKVTNTNYLYRHKLQKKMTSQAF